MKESHSQIKNAWYDFVREQKTTQCVRPLVAQSWLRCFKQGLDPQKLNQVAIVEKPDLQHRIKRNKMLLQVALPIMHEVKELVKGSGFLTLITDADGVILEIICDEDMENLGSNRNLTKGGIWREDQTGTSAVGLVIQKQKPIQIIGPEHYFEVDHNLTCSAAPISSQTGNLLGVLNMSGLKELVYPHTLGMVVAASKAIANQLHIENNAREILLINQYLQTIIETISDGVIAIDCSGRIKELNTEAAKILAINATQAKGNSLSEILDGHSFLGSVVNSGQSIIDSETVIDTKRGRIHCLTSASPIINGDKEVVGAVATLKEIKRFHRVVNQVQGAEARFTFDNIIGESSVIKRAIHLAKVAGRSFSTVLIQGESGTGKELFAQAIHNTNLVGQPFVAVNCGALPESLIESELFGYEEGAFTGANKNGRPGKFELANGGTIFLDEIGEMPLNTQVVLLRVLQERCIQRIGSTRTTPINVRIIAATNKDLAQEVKKGNFRQDLYYRLNVFKIDIPPLRERKTDIPLYVEHFLQRMVVNYGKPILGVSPGVIKKLQKYDWPGNVRELENSIERAVHVAEGQYIEPGHLPEFVPGEISSQKINSRTNLADLEKQAIIDALEKYGEKQKVAKSLGISRSTLYRRIKKYGLED